MSVCATALVGPALAQSFGVDPNGNITVDGVICDSVRDLVRTDTLTKPTNTSAGVAPSGSTLKVFNVRITCPNESPILMAIYQLQFPDGTATRGFLPTLSPVELAL